MSGLRLVVSRTDLPHAWDGSPIEWKGWNDTRTTLPYHMKESDLACQQCGTIDERICNLGMRPPATDTYTTTITKTTKSGHEYQKQGEVKAWPIIDLYAFRCRNCGHDEVLDNRTGECWDLEEEDYSADGSWPSDRLF